MGEQSMREVRVVGLDTAKHPFRLTERLHRDRSYFSEEAGATPGSGVLFGAVTVYGGDGRLRRQP
jgi:hypothetical protein